MKLLRRQSCVSRRMLRARCRSASRAEEAKIFAGPRVCDARDVERVTGAKTSCFKLTFRVLTRGGWGGLP
eukprot:3241000-Prymnesium_polylepis.1